ncbi:SET domain-containing protein [Pseudovirgaria hyperparasitica]|uniref:SET domain-containing protein n=1 Tax=Pseudovirgaria hyperparasitica TaxID=470096 RepID=A0A6A6W6H7_9PEZI|nr:SET domain-containing protein [Pseudovirgaria hyperparasitica]KAF2757560.1 SET domain-containing protein [Pseudovirgaria hyperparasitica]
MAIVYSPGDEHDAFVKWAKEQGVQITAVAPARFEGKGLGLVAARDINAGECLVKVPAKVLITIDSDAVWELNLPRRSSVQGRLAAYLTIINADDKRNHRLWQATWPSMQEFESVMPFCWPLELQEHLPPTAKPLLDSQQKKYQKDFHDLKMYLPASSEHLFKYFWLIINTRVFYWNYPATPLSRMPKRRSDLKSEDCLALCPFGDYFNHTDVGGCDVTTDRSGYSVVSTKTYKAGEEVFFSYGGHSNDYLLAEYGFMLPNNHWDSVSLDHLIVPKLTAEQKDVLKDDRLLGEYTLSIVDSKPAVCYRTLAALRLATTPQQRYRNFVSGIGDDSRDQETVDEAVERLFDDFAKECSEAKASLKELSGGNGRIAATLVDRWQQIEALLGRS